jgi:hypothetical protein
VRAAGILVGVEALAAAVFVTALVVRGGSAELGTGPVLAEAGFFLLVTAAVGAVAAGLATGRRGARTPALVTQLLLLPVVYSLLASRQILIGVVCGAVVFAAFMLLVNERSRAWSMGLDPSDRPAAP